MYALSIEQSRSPRGSVDWNTFWRWASSNHITSLPSWERGLKSRITVTLLQQERRSPRGSVDWNVLVDTHKIIFTVAPLVGAWIEISNVILVVLLYLVAPLVGAWIEICWNSFLYDLLPVAPLVGAWIEIYFSWHLVWYSLRRSPRGSVDWNYQLI